MKHAGSGWTYVGGLGTKGLTFSAYIPPVNSEGTKPRPRTPKESREFARTHRKDVDFFKDEGEMATFITGTTPYAGRYDLYCKAAVLPKNTGKAKSSAGRPKGVDVEDKASAEKSIGKIATVQCRGVEKGADIDLTDE